MPWPARAGDAFNVISGADSVGVRALLERLSCVSVRGLTAMYDARARGFPHTLRVGSECRPPIAQGMSLRYSAIAVLGLSRLGAPARRAVLRGQDLPELLPGILGLALASRDPGALALSVWATLEVASAFAADPVLTEQDRLARALDRLLRNVRTSAPVPTVDHAWSLVALLEAARSDRVAELAGGAEQLALATDRAAERLVAAQGASGLFPHHLPADRLGRFRFHVSCFADQVYPIQALTRYAAAGGDAAALGAAARCADQLVALQGDDGQWWWHYDWRHGTVVERYPVYSVHQHALAPMALMELREAGGPDHRAAVASGLGWVLGRPESAADLIAEDLGVVWRKVGRHERSKIVRKLRSAVSATHPGLRLPWLDLIFPAGHVDRECRPFELGWLLYAWHPDRQLVPTWPEAPEHVDVVEPVPGVEGPIRVVLRPREVQAAGERP
jgi:hypothetical protein